MDKVLLYGIGNDGKCILEGMNGIEEELGIKIIALIDKVKMDCVFGYPVYQPDKIGELPYDYILVSTEKYYLQIRKELEETFSVSPEKITLWNQRILGRGKERYYCNICKNKLPLMLKYDSRDLNFSAGKVVERGERKASRCPFCNSLHRNRWVWYVMEHHTDIFDKGQRILHFAPERGIESEIRKLDCGQYITVDLEPGRADMVMDITNITFPDNTFDYIICNHVLEHIKQETQDLSELRRCLKDDGRIIFSVPVCLGQNTIEEENTDTPEKRLLMYGQEDHVRLYGNDIQERLLKNGFRAVPYMVSNYLPAKDIHQMGLIPEDIVWILEKDI